MEPGFPALAGARAKPCACWLPAQAGPAKTDDTLCLAAPRCRALRGQHNPGGLSEIFAAGFESHGCAVDLLSRTAPWEVASDPGVGLWTQHLGGASAAGAAPATGAAAVLGRSFFGGISSAFQSPGPAHPLDYAAARLRVAFDLAPGRNPTGRSCPACPSCLDRWLLKGFREKIGELEHM